jgi:hypothetical protein
MATRGTEFGRLSLTVSLKNRKKNRIIAIYMCRGKLAMSVQLYWKRVIFSDEHK